jgi:hypothetical protein
MTITYTFHYRFFPKQWSAPIPPDETEDIQKVLEFRLLVAPYLRDVLDALNTWRTIIKWIIYPIFILAFGMSIISWLTFIILTVIVLLISIVMWVKIKIFHRIVSYIQIMIDEIIYAESGIRLPKLLESE